MTDTRQQFPAHKPRLDAIDMARGIALVAMAIYHFTWDLEFFGYADPGLSQTLPWKSFARAIASSFVFLAGVSLVMAHGDGFRRNPFLKRLAMIAAAALAISVASYFFTPRTFIFFGILHAIGTFSIIGLLFLRLPWWFVALAAIAAIAAPWFLRSPIFDIPALWWLGLAPRDPSSNDYVPLFPWFGAFLLGMALARWRHPANLKTIVSIRASDSGGRALAFAGRHSLAVYLLHQPMLIAAIWVFSQFSPAAAQSPENRFVQSCVTECRADRDEQFCRRYCICMLDTLEANDKLDDVLAGSVDDLARDDIRRYAFQCSVSSGGPSQ